MKRVGILYHPQRADSSQLAHDVLGILKASGVSVWQGSTGDEDGLLLSFAREAEGTLEFTTGPVTCSLDLEELACNPVVLDAGGVEQRVIFELAPDVVERDLTWSAEVEPSSEHAISGVIPYHLRIRQVDGHRAWTSPWFVRV